MRRTVFLTLLSFLFFAACTPTDEGEPVVQVGEACSGTGTICSDVAQDQLLRCDNGVLVIAEECGATGKACENGACVADEEVGGDCTGKEGRSACAGSKLVVCTDNKWTESKDCATEDKLCVEEEGGAVCKDKPEEVDNTPPSDETVGEGDAIIQPDGEEETPDSDAEMQCTPFETAPCYHGPSNSDGVGICKSGLATCGASGYWGPCEGEVLPTAETCNNGIDENCDGEDGTEANTDDYDGDGYTYCTGDCCEFDYECPVPAMTNPAAAEIKGNSVDDNCDGKVDETISCDNGLTVSADTATSALALAKAAGMCDPWILSAELGLAGTPVTEQIADGPEGSSTISRPSLTKPYYDGSYKTYAVPPVFGQALVAKEGAALAVLSTGPWDSPTMDAANATLQGGDMKTASTVPEDWINRQPNCEVPKAPSCGGADPDPNIQNSCAGKDPLAVQDPIMLTVKLKVPINAVAFQMNTYFCSIEYPTTVCSSENYNDFFIALLDSTYNEVNPTSSNPNPFDKNLAKDEAGNPVGVDLAPAGLFKICNPTCGGALSNTNPYGVCTGDLEIVGTGFESQTIMGMCSGHGCTGWLLTAGNVVPGEEITLRFAVFEQGSVAYGPDHSWDSTILLDNFEWLTKETKPGTGAQE
ncbi:MAG TPA: MopE-related protein [bacterium]|nr:MopE-related protein [bacterium]